ncbi:hypothetical protein [Pseudonocardia sp. WMMC193]|uniref:hypothetical protein n=1 Tax=Pseudonocardia sp. WMMC193 TaxID=2911965 RepID=UPI001F35599C|nr:hypothetical protein [Pseudonocardia sp. WMMC193]MCF7552980.1 hypothetical protein [Pseudonocardia sp. WMMC193]
MTSSLRSRDPRPDPSDGARATGAAARVPDGPHLVVVRPSAPSGDAAAAGWPTGRRRRPAGARAPWDRRGPAPIPAPRPAPAPRSAWRDVPRESWTAFAVELAALAAVAVVAWLTLRGLAITPVARAAAAASLAGGTAAAVMIAAAGRASGSRRAERIAAAVACATPAGPLGAALELRGGGLWPVVGLVGLLAAVALLVLAVRRRSSARRPVVLVAAGALACAVAAAGTLDSLVPGVALPPAVGSAAALAVWAGAGAAGLLAVAAGVRRDRPLLRRVGLAFALPAAAHAVSVSGVQASVSVALDLAATVALLAAAVPFLFGAVRRLQEEREAYRAEVESLRASVERRG